MSEAAMDKLLALFGYLLGIAVVAALAVHKAFIYLATKPYHRRGV